MSEASSRSLSRIPDGLRVSFHVKFLLNTQNKITSDKLAHLHPLKGPIDV